MQVREAIIRLKTKMDLILGPKNNQQFGTVLKRTNALVSSAASKFLDDHR